MSIESALWTIRAHNSPKSDATALNDLTGFIWNLLGIPLQERQDPLRLQR